MPLRACSRICNHVWHLQLASQCDLHTNYSQTGCQAAFAQLISEYRRWFASVHLVTTV